MIEIEIKARVKDFNEIKKNLEAKGAELIGVSEQKDIIFGHQKHLDENNLVIEGGIAARIRQTNNDIYLDFKERESLSGGIELRSAIHDIKKAKEFLAKLDFKEAFAFAKVREKYQLNGFTVCLDKVERLGNFIEVEKMIKDEDQKLTVKKACEEKLRELVSDFEIEKRLYGDMIQEMINNKEW